MTDTAGEIVNAAVRDHGRDASLPSEFIDALTAGIDLVVTRLGAYERALEAIQALDFKKAEHGGDDYYSGPDKFITAWLIAHRALNPGPDSKDAVPPLKEER
jgi:hypothetical protein